MSNRFELGLMSVTFRHLGIANIAALAAQHGLDAISWSGDVHVPPEDASAARLARTVSQDADLRIEGYGSYWRATDDDAERWLDAAVDLGAGRVRIWAGSQGSEETTSGDRAQIVSRIAHAADAAQERELSLALEFHRDTLTDTGESTGQLLREVAAERPDARLPLLSYWQPRTGVSVPTAERELAVVGPVLAGLHVFSWDAEGVRYPLAHNREHWVSVLSALPERQAPHELMLEFVLRDDPEQLTEDVPALREFVRAAGGQRP